MLHNIFFIYADLKYFDYFAAEKMPWMPLFHEKLNYSHNNQLIT